VTSQPEDPLVSAMLLAAIATGDERTTRTRLAPALRARLDRMTDATTSQRVADRGAFLASLARAALPSVASGEQLPAAARAIVAPLAPREVGARWMREAAPPRAGFRATAGLRATLAAISEDPWRA
jgi:hypothetical protein